LSGGARSSSILVAYGSPNRVRDRFAFHGADLKIERISPIFRFRDGNVYKFVCTSKNAIVLRMLLNGSRRRVTANHSCEKYGKFRRLHGPYERRSIMIRVLGDLGGGERVHGLLGRRPTGNIHFSFLPRDKLRLSHQDITQDTVRIRARAPRTVFKTSQTPARIVVNSRPDVSQTAVTKPCRNLDLEPCVEKACRPKCGRYV